MSRWMREGWHEALLGSGVRKYLLNLLSNEATVMLIAASGDPYAVTVTLRPADDAKKTGHSE